MKAIQDDDYVGQHVYQSKADLADVADLLKEERDIIKRYDTINWNNVRLNALKEANKEKAK
jgi:hypothetical protein